MYTQEKDPDERIRMYVNRVDNVKIPFREIDEMYQLNQGTSRSHFQNYLAGTAFEPIPQELTDIISKITWRIIDSQPNVVNFPKNIIVPQVL